MAKLLETPVLFLRILRQNALRFFVFLLLLAIVTPVYTYTREHLRTAHVSAAVGINHQISFQGKLVNPNGTNVTDGNYSIVFSIYTVASGGSNIWTETQTVAVSNGIFQVNLGSVTTLPGSIDFNTDNIYLGIKVGADAEMTPRIQFTAVPQAFNAEKLGGLDKTGFIQNTVSAQTASFNVTGTGVVGTSLTTPTLQSGAGVGLTITGNAASTWSTTAGNLTIQSGGAGNIVLNSAGVIDLQDNLQNSTGDLVLNDQVQIGGATGLQVTTAGVITDIDGASVVIGENLSVTAGGASIVGNTTIATTAGNTLSLGNSTGQLTITGSATSTFNINSVVVDATEFNRLNGTTAALVDADDSLTSTFGTIDTGDTITGTTLNGTTGINTGAGAGTQRIDASGNLVNINNASVGGSLTVTNSASVGSLYVDGNLVLDMPSNNPETGPWNPIWSALAGSKAVYSDPEFAVGTNNVNVYNNSGGPAVTITRQTGQTGVPNSTGNWLKIDYDGVNPTSPGFGGFYQDIIPTANKTYAQRFMAKVPVGKTLNIAENSQGTNYTSYWLTNNVGTGKWEEYIRVSHAGNTGTFSGGGHIYISGGSGAFSWYLASINLYEVDSSILSGTNTWYGSQTFAGTGNSIVVNNNALVSGTLNIQGANSLQTGGTTRLTSAGVLQNVTNADASTFFTGGTLGVARGGTGIASYTVGDLLYANGASSLAKLAAVASGSCLISQGVGVAPTWGSCATGGGITGSGTNGQVTYFNGASTVTSSANLLFNGTTLTANTLNVTNNGAVGGTLSVTGTINNLSLSGTSIFGDGSGSLTIAPGGPGNNSVVLNGNGTGTVALGNNGTSDVLLGGGSGSTGCTVTNTTGNFACSGTLQGSQLISTVATGTAPLVVSSTTLVGNLNVEYLGGYRENQLAQNLRSNVNITGGGTTSYTGSGVSWDTRMIVIANGNGSDFSTAGYFDITMPVNGTVITGVGGASNATVASGAIPLGTWQALYYILPIGSGSGTVNANFRIATYTGALQVPSNWVLVAIQNPESNTVRFATGLTLRPGQSSTSGTINNTVFNTSVSSPLLVSTVATGTAPLTVSSTTKVTNLNVDLLDGLDSTAFALATVAANQQLSNLSGTVAVNASLNPGVTNTIDLGSSTKAWRNLYIGTVLYVDEIEPFTPGGGLLIGDNASSITLGSGGVDTFAFGVVHAAGVTVNAGTSFNLQRNTTNYTGTGTQNDVNLPGALVRVTSASPLTITSIASPEDGRILTILNASATTVTIQNDSGGTAANRIITGSGGNITIAANASVTLAYDSSSTRWRVIGSGGLPTGSGNYIQNGTSPQTANFNITGNGTIGGDLNVANSVNTTDLAVSSDASVGGMTYANGGLSVTGALSSSGGAITLTGTGVSSFTSGTSLSLQAGSGGISITTQASSLTSGITIQSGNASSFTSGAITIDTGTYVTGSPLVNLGVTNAGGVQIGRTGKTTTVNGALTVTQNATFNSNVLIKPTVNGSTILQVQTAEGGNIIQASTSSNNGNLVTNGSLEVNTTGWNARTGATLSRTTTATNYYYGTAAAQTVNTATAGAGINYPLVLSPSTSYVLTVMLKATVNDTFSFGYAADGVTEATYVNASTYTFGGTEWYQACVTFTTPGSVNAGAYIFLKQNTASAKTVYMDGLRAVPSGSGTNCTNVGVGGSSGGYQDNQINLAPAGTSVLIGGAGGYDTAPTSLNAALFVQQNRGSKGLVVRSSGGNDFGDTIFEVQQSDGSALLGVNHLMSSVNFTGGNSFYNVAALQGGSINDATVAARINGYSATQSANILEVRAYNGGSNVLAVKSSGADVNGLLTITASNFATTWTARTAAGDNDTWHSVTYGNGKFVAVGIAIGVDRVMTSPDGITWTVQSAAGNNDDWQSVTYGNGLFVAVASGLSGDHVMTSPDGVNWTARTAAGDNDNWFSVTYGNGRFVAVGTGSDRVMTSPDGITWTVQSAAGNNDSWISVTYGNGKFVAVSVSSDRVMTSPDGITWTVQSAAGNNDNWTAITYGNGLFVAVGSGTAVNDHVMTSPDGITWTVRSAAGNDDDWGAIAYGNAMFVAVSGFGDRVMTSPDGITWTVQSAAGNNDSWAGLTYNNGQFVAVGTGASGDHVITSPGRSTALQVSGDSNLKAVNLYSNTPITYNRSANATGFAMSISATLDTAGASNQPRNIVTGDFDGDGDKDLVETLQGASVFQLWKNDGHGNFSFYNNYLTGSNPTGLAAADFDRNGTLDIVVANWGGNSIMVFSNDGVGNFSNPGGTGTSSSNMASVIAVTAGDVNGDGYPDILAATLTNPGWVNVLMNPRNGGWNAIGTANYSIGVNPDDIKLADVDGDGDLDAMAANASSNSVSLLRNNGAGGFAVTTAATTGATPEGLALGDLDGDGDPDLVTANTGTNTLSVFRNDGTGSFTLIASPVVGTGPWFVQIADLDGDGSNDLAATLFNGGNGTQLVIARNTSGDGTGYTGYFPSTSTGPLGLDIADVDGDGDKDAVVAAYGPGGTQRYINIMRNTGMQIRYSESSTGSLNVTTADSSTGGIFIKGSTGQTASYLTIQNAVGENLLSVDANGNLRVNGAITGGVNSPDYAENIGVTDNSIEAADVVTMDPHDSEKAVKAEVAYDSKLLGVISTSPGFVTNATSADEASGADQRPLALSGRVPVKVSTINGEVKQGDYLTSSTLPGFAMKATGPGAVIGVAMADFDGTQGGSYDCEGVKCGKVQMFINPSAANPAAVGGVMQGGDAVLNALTVNGALSASEINVGGLAQLNSLKVVGNAQIGGDLTVNGSLTVRGAVSVGNLTVNGHMLTTGDVPVVTAGPGAGQEDQTHNIPAPVIMISGNDTSGTITLTAGANATNDELVNLAFAQAFADKPRIVISPANRDSAKLGVFTDAANSVTASGFKLWADKTLEAGKTYMFTYYIVQ